MGKWRRANAGRALHRFARRRHVIFTNAPPLGAIITASCRFAILVHGADWMPAEAEKSAGVYEFPGNAELFQAKGEEDELFATLDALL